MVANEAYNSQSVLTFVLADADQLENSKSELREHVRAYGILVCPFLFFCCCWVLDAMLCFAITFCIAKAGALWWVRRNVCEGYCGLNSIIYGVLFVYAALKQKLLALSLFHGVLSVFPYWLFIIVSGLLRTWSPLIIKRLTNGNNI